MRASSPASAAMLLLSLLLPPCANAGATTVADPASDAPEQRFADPARAPAAAASYAQALQAWRSAEDINAWIGARFEYDAARALLLSETQRSRQPQAQRLPIHEPAAFFAAPSGVCVDLARFGVESLRIVEPGARAAFVMIEFEPVRIAGNTLRRHWLASFEREGRLYFFADSKRPGHLAGPYASLPDFIADYARYRGRGIVAFSTIDSHQRQPRRLALQTQKEQPTP